MKKIFLILILVALPNFALANFTENTTAPTQNNSPIPINTSGNTQVKTGA